MILLKGFSNLFGQWLQEKINREQNIPCYLWDTSFNRSELINIKSQHIILQELQHKDDMEKLNDLSDTTSTNCIIIWWSGRILSDDDIIYLLNKGANAIVNAKQELPEFLRAIEEVRLNGIYYNEIVNKALHQLCLRNRILKNRNQAASNLLGTREKQIIELRYTGKTSKEIAEILFLSKKTIDKLFGDLYRRFECNNFFELLNACEYKYVKESTLTL